MTSLPFALPMLPAKISMIALPMVPGVLLWERFMDFAMFAAILRLEVPGRRFRGEVD